MRSFVPTTVVVFALLLFGGCGNPGEIGKPPASAASKSVEVARLESNSGAATQSSGEKDASRTLIDKDAPQHKAPMDRGPMSGTESAPRSTGILLTNVPPTKPKAEEASVRHTSTVKNPGKPSPGTMGGTQKESSPALYSEPILPRVRNENAGFMLGAGVLCFAVIFLFYFRYSKSESARIRRSLRDFEESFESTKQGQKDLLNEIQLAAQAAAAAYQADIIRGYMQSVSIDEVRKVAPGLRLQPLRDRGITNLLAYQGWNADRLRQLRGIGPDSANKIALACAALTATVNRQRIPHPSVSDTAPLVQKLFRQIYNYGKVRDKFQGQEALLSAVLKELKPKIALVRAQTAFMHWLFGSENKGALSQAIKNGLEYEAKMNPQAELGQTLADATSRLTEAREIVAGPAPFLALRDDVSNNSALYLSSLGNLLGPNSSPSTQFSSVRLPPRITEPVAVRPAGGSAAGFTISVELGQTHSPRASAAAAARAADCWVGADREVSIGNLTIPGGMLYVGRKLLSINGSTIEPALIDPTLPIESAEADCHARVLNYWSSYSYASAPARASYLQWLLTGRKDPDADVGYVFLYFYGLERRVLGDAAVDAAASAEIPAIIQEVRRLRAIYGRNGSFKRYSSEFLDYVEASASLSASSNADEATIELTRYYLSFSLRRKLGRLAASGNSVPVDVAYAWYHNDPRTRLLAAAERCPEQFAALFADEYRSQFGEGMILPANKTRLKIMYRPASASFGGTLVQSADIPDVAVLSGSYSKLEAIGTQCFAQLDGYSRFVGRNKNDAEKFVALVLLPPALWPPPIRAAIENIKARISQENAAGVMTLQEALGLFGEKDVPARSVYVALCRALAQTHIGLEPDPDYGGEVPSADDQVAFFKLDTVAPASPGFGLAALLTRLASAVAAADGDFTDMEAETLHKEILGNKALIPAERQRLLARVAIYRLQPPKLTGLKPTIERMNAEVRLRVIDFLLAMVYANRVIAPGEVKVMEKIYALCGFETSALYTRLHELSSGNVTLGVAQVQNSGTLKLDVAKIEQLKTASAEVSKKLAAIFQDQDDDPPDEKPEPETVTLTPGRESSLLEIDTAHGELLAVLVGRAQWTRAEFEELCADKGLMPDGAIERINDAAFAKYDQPLIEGDDPLEIGLQLLEKI